MNPNSFLHETTSKIHLKSNTIICTSCHHIVLCLLLPFLSCLAVVLFRPIRPTNDGNRHEDGDSNFIDVPEGDSDDGKS